MAYPITPMSKGAVYGRLTLTGRRGIYHKPSGESRATWECLCQCGESKFVPGNHLRRGLTRSCGCLARENAAQLKAWRNGS
jgi:hypothetical protein